jgi:hypothetical protein
MVVIVALWCVIAVAIGAVANLRGRWGFGWFLLAVCLSPLIAGILLAVLPDLYYRVLEAPYPIERGRRGSSLPALAKLALVRLALRLGTALAILIRRGGSLPALPKLPPVSLALRLGTVLAILAGIAALSQVHGPTVPASNTPVLTNAVATNPAQAVAAKTEVSDAQQEATAPTTSVSTESTASQGPLTNPPLSETITPPIFYNGPIPRPGMPPDQIIEQAKAFDKWARDIGDKEQHIRAALRSISETAPQYAEAQKLLPSYEKQDIETKKQLEAETAPEPKSSDEIPVATERKAVSATISLNSDPQGADATASLGGSCRTPCSIELSVQGPFTVTFTHQGFVPSTIPVQIEPAQPAGSDAKFAPDPVFAALQPVPAPKTKTKPARTAASRPAPPRNAPEATSNDGLLSRAWKYVRGTGSDVQNRKQADADRHQEPAPPQSAAAVPRPPADVPGHY